MDPSNVNTALASAMSEEFARCGVRQAVVSPGSRSTPLAVALWRQPEIEVTVAIDERSGCFFALGAAQANGRPVVLLCTSGTAAANFHPAVAEADLSAAPLIVLTADRPPELRGIGAGQTIDQIKLYGSAVRWFSEVGVQPADDTGLIHFRATACRAFAVAAGDPRPGPVHLNLPLRDPLAPSRVEGSVTATDPLALEGRRDRPLTAVLESPPNPADDSIESVRRMLAESERTAILAGRQTSTLERDAVVRFARASGAPILAEPTSQLRCGPHERSQVISAYDRIARQPEPGLAPDLIIRFGEMPTSKALRTWLGSLEGLRQAVVDPGYGWHEPLRTADVILRADPTALLTRLGEGISRDSRPGFFDSWAEAERSALGQIDRELDSGNLTAGSVHRALAAVQENGDLVYTASSMAIRDQEHYLAGSDTDLLFLANRGANGIDGLLASGIGAAAATGRTTTLITGDIGFQHDIGSLALVSKVDVPIRIVVLNDCGGSIFSRLPQKAAMDPEEFEALMTTPEDLNFEAAAELFGTPYFRIENLAELDRAFESGSVIAEIRIES